MPAPLVSFCIATRNRGPVLVDCLKEIFACGLPANQFEILVVDNASTDQTAGLVAARHPLVQWIPQKKNFGPVAKNIAMQRSQAEFVVLLDDDAYPQPGAVPRMIHHFRENPELAAAVFDVTLPDGSKEASAYPDVFIGAGTGIRRSVLAQVGFLPPEFFMQAEEYDLSFRILNAGGKIRRFSDLPLLHLKTPAARIGERATRLDVRNNLYLLSKYVPAPLCHELAADWLTRYWWMAQARDASALPPALRPVGAPRARTEHRRSYLAGSAEGMAKWSSRRGGGKHLLKAETIETIFKFQLLARRMSQAKLRHKLSRVLFADVGKNMLAYYRAALSAAVKPIAIIDDTLAQLHREYRGIPVLRETEALTLSADAIIVSNLSPVHAPRRAAALRRVAQLPVLDLLEPSESQTPAEVAVSSSR